MYRIPDGLRIAMFESPHKRGDVPARHPLFRSRKPISPQAWGCTDTAPITLVDGNNLPTSVGMYRRYGRNKVGKEKSPHKRGDVPFVPGIVRLSEAISPQAWGCTLHRCRVNYRDINLPTSVGMYRKGSQMARLFVQSPHKRGDVPENRSMSSADTPISPQAWGCT